MPYRCALLLAFAVSCSAQVEAAEVARLGVGRGHLASRVGDVEWQGLRGGDEIPASSHLRTSPLGPVRIELPAAVLCLAPDTDIDFDIPSRKIVIERGRVLLRSTSDEKSWTVVTGATSCTCLAGSESEISFAGTIGVIVLKGNVDVQSEAAGGVPLRLSAPIEWVSDDRGVAKTSVPAAEDWATRIRKRTEPREEQGLGQLVAKDAQSDSPVRLEVARYHVNVVLQAPVALVQIDQSFFNPYGRQEEGTFVFNLPEGASVSRFAMYVTHDQLIEGELIDRKKADQVYTSIVRSKRDPAILEQIGSNLFRMRVFPIFANDTKRILLDYTIPLIAERGRYRFELPLMSDLKPIWDFGISGVIHPPFAAGSVSSMTHPALAFIETKDGGATFSQRAENVQPPPHLLIDFRAIEDRKPTIRSYAPDANQQYFVVTLPESANPARAKVPEAMDLLVLIDTSESAGNLAQARLAARTLVGNLRPQDRWQLGCVDFNFRPMTSEWLEPRSREARAVLRQLDELFALGESRLDAAVEQSLALFAKSPENRRRVILYIGDGEVSGKSDRSCWQHEAFRSNQANRTEFHAVNLNRGAQEGIWLQQGLQLTGGEAFRVHNGASALRALFEWTLIGMPRAPLITLIGVDGVSRDEVFHGRTWPIGREFHIYGRRKPAKTLEVKLDVANEAQQSFSIVVAPMGLDQEVFTGRAWARNRLESLLTAKTNLDDAAQASIVRLCQEWSLMSPFTAFLVLETEKDYERWNIPRQLRHRYWKPAGAKDSGPINDPLRRIIAARASSPAPRARTAESTQGLRDRARQYLEAAKAAIAKGNSSAAISFLSAVEVEFRELDSVTFESLLAAAKKGLRREQTLNQLKLWQSLLDRRAGEVLPAITPLLLGFSHGGVNPEYLERHPHAMKLLRPMPEFDANPITLSELADAVQKVVGVPVLVDEKTLLEEGFSPQDVFNVRMRGTSIRSFMDLAMESRLLRLNPERHLFRITTGTVCNEIMQTHTYPVSDLIRSDQLPLADRLGNPNLDADTLQRKAVEHQLKKPISVGFDEVPLNDALEYVSEKMGGVKLWIDVKSLSEEGIATDKPVAFKANDLNAATVLDEILTPLHLECMIRGGVLVVTTESEAREVLETRVYSAAGIIDETSVDPNANRNPNQFGYLGMGMGGMGGGMGGGGMGGGMFGGMGGNLAGAPAGAADRPAGVGDIAPPDFDDLEVEEMKSASSNPPDVIASFVPNVSGQLDSRTTSYDVSGSIRMIEESTPGRWENQHGEGGRVTFHRHSFSFAIRQTQRVHSVIAELFGKLRRLPRASRVGTSILANRDRINTPNAADYNQLMRIIEQSTPGKWENNDGEGGRISPHLLTSSLVIRQTDRDHEAIEQLFAQLRRARYIAESVPWMTSLEGVDDLVTILDRPSITDLPRNNLEAKPLDLKAADEVRQLTVRKAAASLNQRWRNISNATGRRHDFTLRRAGNRMEVVLLDRILRAEGPRGAAAYPGLTLVEIDAWGDAIRKVADSSLPWLLHRSNEELAQLFDVTTESENATATTLRLTFPGQAETYLKATFSKQTGEPLKWQSVLVNEPQYELQIAPTLVVAVDPSGQEQERWELISDAAASPLPSLEDGWGEFIAVDASKSDQPLSQARAALRRGDREAATKLLSNLIGERPRQPLLNFLFAWSIGVPDESNSAQARLQRESLGRVAVAGSSDLLRLITPGNFPAIGVDALHEILLAVPVAQRTEDLWERLNELAAGLERYDLALSDIDHAIAATSDAGMRIRRQVTRVDLLLKNTRPLEAEDAAKSLVASGVSPLQLVELGDIFGRAEQATISDFFFKQYVKTPNLSRGEKSQALYRQATWLKKGEMRWRLLLAADAEHERQQIQVLRTVLAEADQPEDSIILGKLASEHEPGLVQTQIFIRQAELTADKGQAADIAWKLHAGRHLPESRILWLVELLEFTGRYKDVVEVVEQRLRKARPIKESEFAALVCAYEKLGKDADFRRAMSGREGTPKPLHERPGQINNPAQTGQGFFRVP